MNDEYLVLELTDYELSVLTDQARSHNMNVDDYVNYIIEKAVEDDKRERQESPDYQGTEET